MPTHPNALSAVLPEPGQAPENKSGQVQAMFDRIAATYDLLNDCISFGAHRHWKQVACDRLQLKPGDRVLDVCTGTGDLVGALLPRVEDAGSVVGLDFSAQMLAVAQKRFTDRPNVSFVQGDALALPFEDASFDGAIISFGLRNVVDIPAALAEMRRVLKPGARMVNLDTAPAPKLPGMQFYFSTVMPRIGQLLSKDEQAYTYLNASTRNFLSPDQLKAAFEAAGCELVTSETLMLGSVSLQTGRRSPL